jgi:hypothetical protein
MRPDLMTLAASFGPRIEGLMKEALQSGDPRGGGIEETRKFFGQNFEAACYVVAPVVVAIDNMVPGFKDWLEVTGYGDDRYMMVACLEIANALARRRKPADARSRPDGIPLPKHL